MLNGSGGGDDSYGRMGAEPVIDRLMAARRCVWVTSSVVVMVGISRVPALCTIYYYAVAVAVAVAVAAAAAAAWGLVGFVRMSW